MVQTVRAGNIGPVRREVTFEPVYTPNETPVEEPSAPSTPAPAPVKEPQPA